MFLWYGISTELAPFVSSRCLFECSLIPNYILGLLFPTCSFWFIISLLWPSTLFPSPIFFFFLSKEFLSQVCVWVVIIWICIRILQTIISFPFLNIQHHVKGIILPMCFCLICDLHCVECWKNSNVDTWATKIAHWLDKSIHLIN